MCEISLAKKIFKKSNLKLVFTTIIVPFDKNSFLFQVAQKSWTKNLKNSNSNPPTTPNKLFQQENFIKLNWSNNEIEKP